MNYLLDSDVIIYHLRNKKSLEKVWVEHGAISIVTQAELLYGVYKSANVTDNLTILNNFIADFHIKIIGLNEEIIHLYAQTKTLLEKKGERLDEFDLLIGSTAVINHLTLATNNKSHFKRIPNLTIAS